MANVIIYSAVGPVSLVWEPSHTSPMGRGSDFGVIELKWSDMTWHLCPKCSMPLPRGSVWCYLWCGHGVFLNMREVGP